MSAVDNYSIDPARHSQQRGPLVPQPLRSHPRPQNPSWNDRAIIYDCSEKKLEVGSKKEVKKNWDPDLRTIKLKPRTHTITLFFDPATESEPTTENATDGHSNVMLAKLYLNRLGTINQILRRLGHMKKLYVIRFPPWSETASSASASE